MPTLPRTSRARWVLGAGIVVALAAGVALNAVGDRHIPDGWSAHGLGDGGQLAVPDGWAVVDGGASALAEAERVEVTDQLPTTLHRDGGADTEVVWLLSDSGGRHAPMPDADPRDPLLPEAQHERYDRA